MRTISVRAYPTTSSPGLLDRLNELGVSYRWVCRFLPLDKEDARKAVTTVRKRWFAKRKGVLALLKEAITREPSQLEDPDAAAKTTDADAALAILGGDYASIGYFTPTDHADGSRPGPAGRPGPGGRKRHQPGRLRLQGRGRQRRRGLGRQPARPGLCRSAPAARLVAEPLRHDADVGHLARADPQRPPDRRVHQARPPGRSAAAHVRQDRRHDALPLRPAPGRRRPHHDRGPDGLGQIGPPEHHRRSVASLSRGPGLLLRQGRQLARLHPADRRPVLCPGRRSERTRLPAPGRDRHRRKIAPGPRSGCRTSSRPRASRSPRRSRKRSGAACATSPAGPARPADPHPAGRDHPGPRRQGRAPALHLERAARAPAGRPPQHALERHPGRPSRWPS